MKDDDLIKWDIGVLSSRSSIKKRVQFVTMKNGYTVIRFIRSPVRKYTRKGILMINKDMIHTSKITNHQFAKVCNGFLKWWNNEKKNKCKKERKKK